jgi:hypothetical protein
MALHLVESADPERILVVEDDDALRGALADALGVICRDVRTAATLADAFRDASQAQPDIIILDLGLPDGDGTELVKALLFSTFEGGLRHGLFHGDLHAGNLLVDAQGRIVFLDFGIMGRIDPRTRWLLRELVHALLVKKDHAAAGKILVLMGAVGTTKPEAEAADDLEAFAAPLTLKSLGDMFRNQTEFAGAAILGDGRVGLILDINSLVKLKSKNGDTAA